MCSSHGTALSLLVHLLLLSCQVRSPRGEQLRGVGRRGTEECESLVGCGEAAQRASIPESSQGSLWIEGLVPYVFQANLGECKTPDSGVVVYADPVPGRGVVWCCSTPVVCSRNHSIYHRALVCVCCTHRRRCSCILLQSHGDVGTRDLYQVCASDNRGGLRGARRRRVRAAASHKRSLLTHLVMIWPWHSSLSLPVM